MKEKLSAIENVLFIIFLIVCPTTFYIYQYPTCYSLELRHDAFYFYLALVAFFGLFFAFLCCFSNIFLRPIMNKRLFMLFSFIFIPWLCRYAAKTYFYYPYFRVTCTAIGLLFGFILVAPRLPGPRVSKKDCPISENIFCYFIFFFPAIYSLYLLPSYPTFEEQKAIFFFTYTISLYIYFPYMVFTTLRLVIPHFGLIKKLIMLFAYLFIPCFSAYGIYVNHPWLYGGIFIIINLTLSFVLSNFIEHLPTNEEGRPIRKPQPPEEN